MSSARELRSAVEVAAGLFALRYAAGPEDGSEPPFIRVDVPAAHRKYIQIVATPGDAGDALDRPGSVLVVRAERAGSIALHAMARSLRGSVEAQVKLERLGFAPAAAPVRHEPAPRAAAVPSLEVLAHVARRGDTRAAEGQWIAGPEYPLPIEGLSISGPVALEYQIKLGSPSSEWTTWARNDEFIGARGRAARIFGLRVRLAQNSRASGRLTAEALFLSRSVTRAAGPEIEFISQSAREPLVGISLKLEAGEAPPKAIVSEQPRSGRVRVFRSAAA